MQKNTTPSMVPALVCALLLLVGAGFFGSAWLERRQNQKMSIAPDHVAVTAQMQAAAKRGTSDMEEQARRLIAREQAGAQWRELLRGRLERGNARIKEAVVIFKNNEAYRRFQIRARAAGFSIIRENETLRAVRVRYDTIAAVQADIFEHVRDYEEIGANTYVDRPERPEAEGSAGRVLTPVRDGLLAMLGVSGDRSQWGRGVTIAVIDSGVAHDATFGNGRLRTLDVGQGVAPGRGEDDGHGTAVAAIAAGNGADAEGVAPAANLLSVRVTALDGRSDIFTVAEGVVAAVDAGARVINISLGGYDTSVLMTRAIDYAEAAGAVIVAASGNDRAGMLTWPAADLRVISVGATDATGLQAPFSNSGEGLKITAPGVGVQTAWLDGKRVLFSGTSASAPAVSGAIAAVMSQKAGISARQAWEILAARSDDAGAPGADVDYGAGVLNLGWALNADPSRVDLAVASHWIERAGENGEGDVVDVVIQNRGGFSVAGAVLGIEAGGLQTRQVVTAIGAGASVVLQVSVDRERLDAQGRWVLKTRLVTPGGMVDQVPTNNERVSALQVSER
jgi:hypothetical protein